MVFIRGSPPWLKPYLLAKLNSDDYALTGHYGQVIEAVNARREFVMYDGVHSIHAVLSPSAANEINSDPDGTGITTRTLLGHVLAPQTATILPDMSTVKPRAIILIHEVNVFSDMATQRPACRPNFVDSDSDVRSALSTQIGRNMAKYATASTFHRAQRQSTLNPIYPPTRVDFKNLFDDPSFPPLDLLSAHLPPPELPPPLSTPTLSPTPKPAEQSLSLSCRAQEHTTMVKSDVTQVASPEVSRGVSAFNVDSTTTDSPKILESSIQRQLNRDGFNIDVERSSPSPLRQNNQSEVMLVGNIESKTPLPKNIKPRTWPTVNESEGAPAECSEQESPVFEDGQSFPQTQHFAIEDFDDESDDSGSEQGDTANEEPTKKNISISGNIAPQSNDKNVITENPQKTAVDEGFDKSQVPKTPQAKVNEGSCKSRTSKALQPIADDGGPSDDINNPGLLGRDPTETTPKMNIFSGDDGCRISDEINERRDMDVSLENHYSHVLHGTDDEVVEVNISKNQLEDSKRCVSIIDDGELDGQDSKCESSVTNAPKSPLLPNGNRDISSLSQNVNQKATEELETKTQAVLTTSSSCRAVTPKTAPSKSNSSAAHCKIKLHEQSQTTLQELVGHMNRNKISFNIPPPVFSGFRSSNIHQRGSRCEPSIPISPPLLSTKHPFQRRMEAGSKQNEAEGSAKTSVVHVERTKEIQTDKSQTKKIQADKEGMVESVVVVPEDGSALESVAKRLKRSGDSEVTRVTRFRAMKAMQEGNNSIVKPKVGVDDAPKGLVDVQVDNDISLTRPITLLTQEDNPEEDPIDVENAINSVNSKELGESDNVVENSAQQENDNYDEHEKIKRNTIKITSNRVKPDRSELSKEGTAPIFDENDTTVKAAVERIEQEMEILRRARNALDQNSTSFILMPTAYLPSNSSEESPILNNGQTSKPIIPAFNEPLNASARIDTTLGVLESAPL